MKNIVQITDLAAKELDIYARFSEVQLLRINEPDTGVFIAESPIVIERALDAGYEPISMLVENKHIEDKAFTLINRLADVPVYTATFDVLTRLTGYKLTRGALCAMKRKKLPTIESICENARRIAIMENVVNPTNVGAIFRSAAALNIDAVLLTSACTDPLYRRSTRVSMGTVFQIPWTIINEKDCPWPHCTIPKLKSLGFATCAMALCENSVSIDDKALHSEEHLAIILGTEGEGLMDETIQLCDYTVKIPMSHGVDSLNVAAASAIAFWELSF